MKKFTLLFCILMISRCIGAETPAQMCERALTLLAKPGAQLPQINEGWDLLRRAADAGSLQAKLRAGEYAAGFLSVPHPPGSAPFIKPELTRALAWLRDAADAGIGDGLRGLARLYSSGIGEPRNADESPQKLLFAAASKGDRDSMLLLSERFTYGWGTSQDFLQAAEWKYRARKLGDLSWDLLDQHGDPKPQSSVPRAKLARILSLCVKARDLHDSASADELQKLQSAGQTSEPR